jgi:hypothetical protein
VRIRTKIAVAFAALLSVAILSGPAFAQVTPTTATVPLSFQQNESLTLTVNSGSPVTFNASGAAGAPISITAAWNIYGTAGESAPVVYPYFSTSTALTTTGSGQAIYNIPTSAFTLAVSGSSTASATACNGTGSYSGGNANTFSNPESATDNCPALFDGTATSYFNDSNTSGGGISTDSSATWSLTPALTNASSFNAGTYSGTLNLYAAIE